MKKLYRPELNRKNKAFLTLMQFVILGLFVLTAFNREVVLFVKDFINALPVGSSLVEHVAVKVYVLFQFIASSPSFVMLSFVIIQVMLFAYVVMTWIIIFSKPFVYDKEDIVVHENRIDAFCRNNRGSYLENMRLLF